jgi:hypothetical protein
MLDTAAAHARHRFVFSFTLRFAALASFTKKEAAQ